MAILGLIEHEGTKTRSSSALSLFLRFFVSSCSVFWPQPAAFPHEVDTHDDEGNAEQLAHVQRHALLEGHLLLLEELHKEAEREDIRQAESEVEPRAELC